MNEKILENLGHIFSQTIYTSGTMKITIGSLLLGLFLIFFLIFFLGFLERKVIQKFLQKTQLASGTQYSVRKIIHYFFLTIGILFAMEIIGVGLRSFGLFAGALGVGLGFGLQNLFNNFVCGFLLLVERPIKVGDYLELGADLRGRVDTIGIRSTTIITNDNISIIVPNSDFITTRVTNWSHNENTIRLRISVGVSYGSDPTKVREALLEVAKEDPDGLPSPTPLVLFKGFGDSSLDFELAVWNSKHLLSPGVFRSNLCYRIHKKFKEKGIEIPFPQRDLHIRSGGLPIS